LGLDFEIDLNAEELEEQVKGRSIQKRRQRPFQGRSTLIILAIQGGARKIHPST
jgi:hypothetical protein